MSVDVGSALDRGARERWPIVISVKIDVQRGDTLDVLMVMRGELVSLCLLQSCAAKIGGRPGVPWLRSGRGESKELDLI